VGGRECWSPPAHPARRRRRRRRRRRTAPCARLPGPDRPERNRLVVSRGLSSGHARGCGGRLLVGRRRGAAGLAGVGAGGDGAREKVAGAAGAGGRERGGGLVASGPEAAGEAAEDGVEVQLWDLKGGDAVGAMGRAGIRGAQGSAGAGRVGGVAVCAVGGGRVVIGEAGLELADLSVIVDLVEGSVNLDAFGLCW
jgi:hypothetical protein